MVAAMMGHSSDELIWRRYGHLFDESRLAAPVGMVDAIHTARAGLAARGAGTKRDGADIRVLRAPLGIVRRRLARGAVAGPSAANATRRMTSRSGSLSHPCGA